MDEIQAQISQLKAEMSAVIAKVDLLNPALFLEFKGTIIETLRVFDRDIEKLAEDVKENEKHDEAKHKELDKKVTDNTNELLVLKTKAALYGSIAGVVVTLFANYILPLLFK